MIRDAQERNPLARWGARRETILFEDRADLNFNANCAGLLTTPAQGPGFGM